MKHLLDFLLRYRNVWLFVALEMVSLVLLVQANSYQQSVWLTSAGAIAGHISELTGSWRTYLHLRQTNEQLLERNLWLEQRIASLENALQATAIDSTALKGLLTDSLTNFESLPARVISNSVNRKDNYITLKGGTREGIRPDMGVVDGQGIVGIVCKASAHYALVIPVLNSKSNISCKLQASGYFGYLTWEGGDPRYAWLKDLPRHAEFDLGDTIVTSGYSAVFPEGMMVGTVDDLVDANDGLSYQLKVKLATDFSKLNEVRVIARTGQEEMEQLIIDN